MSKVSPLWRLLAILFAVISVGLLIALIVVASKDDKNNADGTATCVSGMETRVSLSSSDPPPAGLYDDLTSLELKKVRDYMFQVKSLNLTANKELKINSNRIALIQLYPPAKDDALAFLDHKQSKPERQAIVVVFRGATQPPVVEEYIVGPVDAPTTKHKLRKIDGRDYPISFNARPFSTQEGLVLHYEVLSEIGRKANDLLNESYDGYTYGEHCGNKCLFPLNASPMGLTSDSRENWVAFHRYDLPYYIHPLNFEVYVNHSGSDPSKWRVEKVMYNDQLFDSVEELMEAYRNGSLVKTFIPALNEEEKKVFTYERRGKAQPDKPLRGPELYEPDGRRYTVRGRHIEYMNWAFDFRVDSSTGLQVYDVRFGGDRIAYEISIQEAVATYAGFYPTQMSNNFLDSNFMMGVNSHDLLQGTDCPGTATFFDLVHMAYSDTPFTVKNAVCVFELNNAVPLRRHYDNDFIKGYRFFGSMVNQALVLRTVSTVGNYDYIYDFIFYQSGAIEVKVSLTGYVIGSYYNENVSPYGFKIQNNNLTSTTHDHLINYKVDLDVSGRKNSYETIEIGFENVTDRWLQKKNRRIVKKVLRPSTKTTEQEAAYKFNFDHPKYLNFYNEKSKNKMGVKKGYRIQHNGIMKQLYPEDWDMVPMISWSTNSLSQSTKTAREQAHPSTTKTHHPPLTWTFANTWLTMRASSMKTWLPG